MIITKISRAGLNENHFSNVHESINAIGSVQRKFLVLVGLILYVPVNSYGHFRTVSSPNHTLFLG